MEELSEEIEREDGVKQIEVWRHKFTSDTRKLALSVSISSSSFPVVSKRSPFRRLTPSLLSLLSLPPLSRLAHIACLAMGSRKERKRSPTKEVNFTSKMSLRKSV